MVDIIVIFNNDWFSLVKTLGSISFQNSMDINNVIIINENNINLKNKLDFFKELKIIVVNQIDGNPKNYGIEFVKSQYLMYINSGDYLYNCFSIKNLLVDCDKYDMITGKIAITSGNKVDYYDDMNRYTYGKLYSVKFIKDNKLFFTDTKYFSDMAFNKMFLMCKPRTALCCKEVYFTSNQVFDDNNKECIIDYCKSFKKCIEWAIENKIDNKMIGSTLYSNIVYLYNKYNLNYKNSFIHYIFEYGIDIYNYYLQYNKYLTFKDKDIINTDYILDINYICDFNNFLDMFTNNTM